MITAPSLFPGLEAVEGLGPASLSLLFFGSLKPLLPSLLSSPPWLLMWVGTQPLYAASFTRGSLLGLWTPRLTVD